MTRSFVACLAWLITAPAVIAQALPSLPKTDRIRIAEAFRLADALGNRIWPTWEKAPFAVLLVTSKHEFLIRHPKPSDDFVLVGEDALLRHKVWYRKRKFPTNFEATFPAVGGLSTIVIGQAENTASKTSTRWVITLLHEHFHQLQESQPGFQARVNALNLDRGDQTGMWMLNYPFPYTTPELNGHFSAMSKLLAGALRTKPQADFSRAFKSYVEARKKFQSMLKADDYKYFAFQVWKEGIARYTEYHLAKLAAAEYQPSKEFQKLKDYRSFQEVAHSILGAIEKELASVQLDKAKRTVVYNFGAAEGLVLDRASPNWRKRYLGSAFSLDEYFRDP